MLKETLHEAIQARMGYLKTSPKQWLTRNCMLCQSRGHSPDRRGRFGIRYDADGSIYAHCFNCGFKTGYTPCNMLSDSFVWFLREIGVPDDDVKKLKFQSFREKEAGEIYEKPVLRGDVRKKWNEFPLPDGAMPIYDWLVAGCGDANCIKAAEYCLSRKLDPKDMLWSPHTGEMMNRRVIIPFYYNGKIVGYTGRYYQDKLPTKSMRRYLNHAPESFLYNLDMIGGYERPFVILCEGVLDAYLVKGISCMGTLNQDQIDVINTLGKRIIVCPDRDSDGEHLVDAAIDNGWEVAFPNWDDNIKDVGKAVQCYGKLLTLRSIVETSVKNPTKIRVNRKMDSFNE